jgi:GR25 family glycosyltransferase involved in LPS biosynthesis
MIKTFGLKKNKNNKKNDGDYIFKPIDCNQNKYEIYILSEIEYDIQFRLHAELIKKINISYDNQIYESTNIPDDGFLISGKINKKNPIIITIDILDLCSRIYIKDLLEHNTDNLINISWDKIYIINLKRRTDRKENMIKEFEKENITNYKFIEAFDGTDDKIIEKFDKLKNKTNIINSGHYACLLSHIKAILLAKKKNYNSVIILEDDVFFDNNFLEKIKNIKIVDYDMIYLGGITSRIKLFFNKWAKTNYIIGAYAYLIKKNIYDVILNELCKLIDFVDLCYLKNIQKQYNVFILDDLIKTNLDSSDTSHKSKMLVNRLNYINNKKNFLQLV